MGRPRTFDERQILIDATELFGRRGFDAVPVDVALSSLGLSRGSFYKIFGSKHALFRRALEDVCERAASGEVDDASKDLVVVGLLEMAPTSPALLDLCQRAVDLCFHGSPAAVGEHLLARAARVAF